MCSKALDAFVMIHTICAVAFASIMCFVPGLFRVFLEVPGDFNLVAADTVILHDSGWMQLRSPVVRPRLLITPPFIGFHGTITSKRKIEAQKGRIVEQTAPLVSAWRDAIASEAAWDASYEPPEHTVEGPDGGS